MARTLFAGLLLLAASAVQALPQQLYSGLSWRFVGPYRGGRVDAVAGVAGRPGTWYLGAVDGGVFETTNAGVTWQPLFQHEPVASVGAIAVAASDPRIVYVGTGESTIRSDASYGDGMYRSDDGGKTWRHIGLDDTRHIGRVLVDPRDPDRVLVAAMGHAWGANAQRGVFLSSDGGKHWKKTLYVDADTGAVDLARDPDHPDSVYATTWNARRPPWFQYAPQQGPGSAIWHSDDGGETWQKLPMQGLPQSGIGRIGIAVAPDTPGPRLYAVVSAAHISGGANSAGEASGVYRSDDGGKTWRRINAEARISGRGWYFGRIYVDPKNPDVVYVPNTSLYRSTDGGKHFTAIKGSPDGDDFHCLWIDPADPARMITGADQGASVSLDDGAHWSSWYNQPTAQIYHLAVDDAVPYRIYATQQDSGALAIPSRSWEGIITNRAWVTIGGGESGYIFPQPGNPRIVFGSGFGGSISRYDADSHQGTDVSPVPIVPFGATPAQIKYYFPWNTALAVSPFAPDTLYVGAQVVLRSTDAGDHWAAMSPVLTAKDAEAECKGEPTRADAAACGYSVIYALAPSPQDKNMIWAGTDDGRIWLTTDGSRWKNVTPPGLGPWSRIDAIEADPGDAATAYAAVDRHGVDDFAPYIYVTHDGGAHWTKIVRGIPAGDYVHVVRADPDRKGLLYAGTEQGVFVSFDDGAHWQPLQLNLPTVSVRDLAIHAGDLVAATHGRGIWILDDIEPLREASAKLAQSAAHLYRPLPAVRFRLSQYNGEAMPPEEPHAANPPTGAIIDYWLGKPPHGPVALAIYAADGSLVRRYSSDTVPAKMPVPNFPAYWEAPPDGLPAQAGLNRFVWDLRYTPPQTLAPAWGGPAVLHRTPRGPGAPLVPPGSYRVVLTVDGKDYSAPLEVRPDPSAGADPATIGVRVRLGLALRDAVDRSTRLIRRARAAAAAAEHSGDAARAKEIRDALAATDLLEANGNLLRLLGSADAADTAPPGPLAAAAKRAMAQVQAASDELAKLLVPGA